MFLSDENFLAYDGGLLTFIEAGAGEEWRLVDVEEEEEASKLGNEWEEVKISVENMVEFLPRMGYLLTDGVFDVGRLAAGQQKFLVKNRHPRLSAIIVQKDLFL